MNNVRTDHSPSASSLRGVRKAKKRFGSSAQLRSAASAYVADDFGLVCHACATVTIFSAGASHPLACSRCGNGLRAPLAG